jgi:hypothetical protein
LHIATGTRVAVDLSTSATSVTNLAIDTSADLTINAAATTTATAFAGYAAIDSDSALSTSYKVAA